MDNEAEIFDEANAWQRIAASPDGQLALKQLIRRFGWTTQTLWNTDAGRMAYNEGQRSVCVHIGRMIGLSMDEATDTTKDRGQD